MCAGSSAEALLSEGFLVFEGVLSGENCDALKEHVLLCSDAAKRLGRGDLLGNIQEAELRSDLKLDLCPPVLEALNALFARCGPVLQEVMGGVVRVVELAAITSDGGAKAQPVHADTMHGVTRFLQSDIAMPAPEGPLSEDEDAAEDVGQIVRAVATETALIFTMLIALQDVEEDMGPTHVWPATNTVEHHATLWGTHTGGKLSVAEADEAFKVPHRNMCLRKGDLVLYDSRTMHCGGENMSALRRSVLCVSTMGPGIRPDGTTWTMLKSLRNKLRLSDFPLSPELAQASVAKPGSVEAALPAPAASKAAGAVEEEEERPVPPLEEWAAAVQCALCRKWRPCSEEEAPRLTTAEFGFMCKAIGFKCSQLQRYSDEEVDAWLMGYEQEQPAPVVQMTVG